jgi:DNA invertase Pin-like site-specific DNA recombinase
MAWNVDRLGRSLKDLVAFLSELHALGINLFLHQQGLDTTTPAGKAMFQMLGVFAEFERSIIQERVRAGLQRAKREGKRLGRPPIADKLAERIRTALAGGMSVRKTAAKFEVNPSTVQRIARPFDDAEHASVAAGLWARQAGALGPGRPRKPLRLTTPTQGGLSDFENEFWPLLQKLG